MFPEPIEKLLQIIWAATPIAVILVGWNVRKLHEQTSQLNKLITDILDRLHEMPEKRTAGVIDTALKAIEEEIKETNSLLRGSAEGQESRS